MNKKEYEAKRAELLKAMSEAITQGDAKTADEKGKEIEALDAQFQELAKAQANFDALNKAPEVPAVGQAIITGKMDQTVEEEKLYEKAFAHYMMGLSLSADENKIFSARNVMTAENNRVAVPNTVKSGIWTEIEELHPILSDLVRTNIHGSVEVIVEKDGGNNARWYDEATKTEDSDVTLGSVTLNGYDLAKAIPVSWKMKKMSVEEFIPYISKRIGEKMGNALAAGVVSGSGAAQKEPKGIIPELEGESSTPQIKLYTDSIKYADLTGIMGLLKSGYKSSAKFFASSTTIWTQLANVLDDNKRPIFIPDVTNAGIGRIFGVPVVEEDAVPVGSVLLGNVGAGYAMNVNEDVTMYYEDHVKERITDYMGYALIDGTPITNKAFALLKKQV